MKTLAFRMSIALVAAIVVGGVCICLRETLVSGGCGATWDGIDRLLFADVSAGRPGLGLFYLVGQLFVRALSLIIIPMVYAGISLAIVRIADAARLRRLSLMTLLVFLLTTLLAMTIASAVAFAAYRAGLFSAHVEARAVTGGTVGGNPLGVLLNAVPPNVVGALSSNSAVLAVVFLAVATGLCLLSLGEARTAAFRRLLTEINDIVLVFLNFTIDRFGPVAVFCLLVRSMSAYGIGCLKPAAAYMTVTAATMLLYLMVAYPLMVAAFTGMRPLVFLRRIAKVAIFGFATSSSAATLALNARTCRNDLGVSDEVTSFVLPLGMTVNMDGTAIMQVVATLFVAGVAGTSMSMVQLLTVGMLVLVASVGTPAAPGAGAVVLFTVLSGIGLTSDPALLAYNLILAINRPLEMLATSLNVTGDAATCLIVDKRNNRA